MALVVDMMRGGTSAGQARAINGAVAPSVSAAGTVIGDATDLRATTNFVTTVGANSGVQLPSMIIGDSCVVYNSGANSLKVYPDASTVAINQLSVAAAVSLPIETGMLFYKVASTQIVAFLSA